MKIVAAWKRVFDAVEVLGASVEQAIKSDLERLRRRLDRHPFLLDLIDTLTTPWDKPLPTRRMAIVEPPTEAAGKVCCGRHGVPCWPCPFRGSIREPKVGCHFCDAREPLRIVSAGTLAPKGWSVGMHLEGPSAKLYACPDHADDLRRVLGLEERPSDG